MNYIRIMITLLMVGCIGSSRAVSQTYFQELKKYKQRMKNDGVIIFNTDAPFVLRELQKDIESCRNLSRDYRVVRTWMGCVAIKPDTMPKLYFYIEKLCKDNGITTPTIFIPIDNGFFNAAASKFFRSYGAIIIGQDLLKELSDEAIEAVIAHEIGHIKYSHTNKKILAIAGAWVAGVSVAVYRIVNRRYASELLDGVELWGAFIFSPVIANFFTTKYFERQADEFACKQAKRGQGLIESLEILKKKEKEIDKNLEKTFELLEQNRSKMTASDYNELIERYYIVKLIYKINTFLTWVFSPLNTHLSHDERIVAAYEHMYDVEQPA